MSATTMPVVTAGLRPELFAGAGERVIGRTLLTVSLAVLVLCGLYLRATHLSAEGLSEDELNKLEAVEDYRAHGLTGANGEHPLLMKALLTASIVAAEKWNETGLVSSHASLRVTTETALRMPSVIFGSLTILVLFLVTAELFGAEVALIAAALWAFDPSAISFNRIAKEDTFFLFFFLLGNVFWLRSQRVAESGRGRPQSYYWIAASCFGAMMASKYLPGYFAASIAYYHIFQGVKATKWRLGKQRFLLFFGIMGLTFLLCNLTILLPGTWRAALTFASYKHVGHNGYEFMGTIHRHKLMDWFKGVPWYFYFVFMAVKLPPATIAAFLVGLPLLFRKKMGDGRYFLLFWTVVGFAPFVFVGGKFTRYFTPELPVVFITAAIGIQFVGRKIARFVQLENAQSYAVTILALLVVLSSAWASASAAPYYRLYTNAFGGGQAGAGYYFPQDEFYDAYMRDLMNEVARRARAGVRVASETPTVAAYYARAANRPDLVCVALSDPEAVRDLSAGDFVVDARGRRYFTNEQFLRSLRQRYAPAFSVSVGDVPAADVYELDETGRASVTASLQYGFESF